MISLLTDKQELTRAFLAQRAVLKVGKAFCTGLSVLDELAPGGSFTYGMVHELLCEPGNTLPTSIALVLAKGAQGKGAGGAIVWSDPARELHPPALAAAGFDLQRMFFLRCADRSEELWALAECLNCQGVSATFASIQRLTQVEARRLQLAAERGGGIGIFHRPYLPRVSSPYAAATRWLVKPAGGDEDHQRWSMELVHGHGGQVGRIVLLEVDRDTCAVRAFTPVADRSVAPSPIRITA